MAKNRPRKAAALARAVANIDPFSHDATAAAVARLAALADAQSRGLHADDGGLAQSHELFERACAAARLGVFECDLATETLQWSDGTYDLFGIARGTPLRRAQVLPCYPAHSLKALEAVRHRAVAERNGFTLDAEIVARGSPRCIRITACVECAGNRPVRLFGLKQDVTAEKAELDRLRRLAEVDQLTGLANRTRFERVLEALCAEAAASRNAGALVLIDLDGFKAVNDSLGHAAGDECLRQSAHRLAAVCGEVALVARIGGDEFAVLLGADATRVPGAGRIAAAMVAAMGPPLDCSGRCFGIGASAGIARITGLSAGETFARADAALYAAKHGGRSTYRWYEPRLAR